MRITIITVTYQAAAVLQRTLDSVSRQTYQDIEHLIIDGASKDDTVKIAKAYQEKVPYPVIIQSEPDHGLYDAMNKGLHKATGDYLVFLNAGDTLHADDTLSTLNSQLSTLNPQSPAVIYGDTAIVDSEGKFLHLRRLRPPKQLTWKIIQTGHARLPSGFLRTYRHRATGGLRPAVSPFRRCRLVHTGDETSRRDAATLGKHQHHPRRLHGGRQYSLKERYQVMCHHYGKASTIVMHAWFLVRQLFR